ncbi:MAG: BREX system P-loop protein BrxC, partial [Candidatus Marinimicrobia bacterium]|nr:BREX system P-loop protein BrxC [Candidatus Neomarinimicrobiota bacterium]
PFDRIVEAFSQLISRAYPNLGMIKNFNYSEDDIERILKQNDDNYLIYPDQDICEPEREIINFIDGNVSNGKRTTLKELVEYFERKPYGWYLAAILCLLARLWVRGKVEFRRDSNLLEKGELKDALLNTHTYGNVILEKQAEFTTSQVKQLKKFYNDFFDQPPTANEAKPLCKETAESFESLVEELKKIMESGSKYPFLKLLKKHLGALEEYSGKPYAFYLSDMMDQKDSLIDMKERLFNPIRSFMNGSLKEIYDEAWDFKENQKHNFDYLEGNEGGKLIQILNDPECFKGDSMRRAKKLMGSLKEKVNKLRQNELTEAINKLQSLRDSIKDTGDFKRLSEQDQNSLLQPFQIFEDELTNQSLIAVIRDRLKHFEEQEYLKILSKRDFLIKKDDGETGEVSEVEYVSLRSIKVGFTGKSITNDEDIEEYISALKRL